MEVLQGDLTSEYYRELAWENTYIGIDLETSGLNKQRDKIACIQFYGDKTKRSVLVRMQDKYRPHNIIQLLETTKVKKIFHHAPFDLSFLIRDYYVNPQNIRCTKIAAKLLDKNKTLFYDPNKNRNNHSYAALVYIICGIKLDKSTSTSNWFNTELTPEQLLYAENDVKYLPAVWLALQRALREKSLLRLAVSSYDFLSTKIRLELLGYNDIYGYE